MGSGRSAVYCRRMSVEPGDEAPVEPIDASPRFNRWVTGVALALLGVLAALLFWPAHGLDMLEWPEASLDRVVTREMDFRAALRTAPVWERRLLTLGLSSDTKARADAIVWYDELVREEGSPLAELHRVVLLAEDGQAASVEAALAAWTPIEPGVARLAEWARAAYDPRRPRPRSFEPLSPRSGSNCPRAGSGTACSHGWRRASAIRGPRRRRSRRPWLAGPRSSGESARSSASRSCSWSWGKPRRPGLRRAAGTPRRPRGECVDSAAVDLRGWGGPLRARRGRARGRRPPVAVPAGQRVVESL